MSVLMRRLSLFICLGRNDDSVVCGIIIFSWLYPSISSFLFRLHFPRKSVWDFRVFFVCVCTSNDTQWINVYDVCAVLCPVSLALSSSETLLLEAEDVSTVIHEPNIYYPSAKSSSFLYNMPPSPSLLSKGFRSTL